MRPARRRRRPFADNPVAVGAITVLITVVVVFMAYNANAGLPFVQAYRVATLVPDGAALVSGNDVRIGGVRVGLIESIEAADVGNGTSAARLNLKLDAAVKPLPKDTTVLVRTRSALGLKYLELTPGVSSGVLEEGATLPLAAARPEPVDLDQVLNVFDERTREGQRRNLVGLGGALAGRGPSLNSALGTLPATLRLLEPVGRNLAAPETELGRFIRASDAAAAEAGPVGERQARMFVSLATTFEAIRDSDPGLARTIEGSPPSLRQAKQSLPSISRLLAETTGLVAELRPSAQTLRSVAPELDRALTLAAPALREAPRLNRQLPPTAAALRAFGDEAGVIEGISALTTATAELSPTLRFVAPVQTVCNYAALLFRNLASVFSLGDGIGTRQRFIAFQPPLASGGEGGPAASPADGPGVANHLHYNPYPNTAAPGQPRECEAGNEPYALGQTVIGNAAGNQGIETEPSR